jgi:pre-mRNA 3'-end-processing factor FIP1
MYPISLQANQTRAAHREFHATKRFDSVAFFPECECYTQCLGTAPAPGPSLTTEYTPRERGAPAKLPATQPPPTGTPSSKPLATPNITAPAPTSAPTPTSASAAISSTLDAKSNVEDGPDPTTFPPVTAPPSHPVIDTNATGMLEGRPVFEVDMAALADKAWRRPGSDISDWFNYGFDEISWEAYCYRRRELGDLAAVLKTNVVVRSLLSLACNLYSKCSFVILM